jgi:hypothetical protein
MSETTERKPPTRLLVVGGAVTLFGLWPYLFPLSFFKAIATYQPYNEHFLHDAGAFLAGLGVALLAAAKWRDGLTVALVANAAAAVLHALGHIQDRNLGGRATDPWLLSLVAIAFAVPTLKRVRRRP